MNPERNALTNLVTVLGHVCGVPGLAVWSCAFGELELRYSSGLEQRLFNLSQRAWRDFRPDFQDGRVITDDSASFVPLMSGHLDLVGVLALAGPVPLDTPRRGYFDDLVRMVSKYVQHPEPAPEADVLVVPVDALVQEDGPRDVQRRAYAALLVRNGWNVSLVAGLMQVPRSTLVGRLRSLKLGRPRPSAKARVRVPVTDGDSLDDARRLLWPRADRKEQQPGRPRRQPR